MALLARRLDPNQFGLFCFFYASALSFQDFQSAAIAGLERFDLEWIFKLIPRWTPFFLLFGMSDKNLTPRFASIVLGVCGLGITLLMTGGLFNWVLSEK